jgi:hypothetical protein
MCAVFGDEILDWDSFDGLSSAMVLPPVEVNKKQFVGMSNLGKAQTKPTFRKSPSGFSFPVTGTLHRDTPIAPPESWGYYTICKI